MDQILGQQLGLYIAIATLLVTLLTVILAAVALKKQAGEGSSDEELADSLLTLIKQQSSDFNRATQEYKSLSIENRGVIQSLALNIQKLNNDLEQHSRYSSSEYNAIREEIFELRKEISRIKDR